MIDWSREDYLWIIVMFLSAVWTVAAQLTAEDPVVSNFQ